MFSPLFEYSGVLNVFVHEKNLQHICGFHHVLYKKKKKRKCKKKKCFSDVDIVL